MKVVEKAKATYRRARAVEAATEKKSRRSPKRVKFSRRKLVSEIMFEARVLGRHAGAVEIFADKVADEVEVWAKKRTYITEDDITRVASEKLKKYDKDLAYIYKNRDTIV
ncbi:hypothetical protein IJ090_02425 [Candidatus Saccharibacteria bacterium]|nr:hypothetical protein [Candidatus Saccharibacteria bacterium]